MKKKQFMSKLAALTMAAMMGATMLPATAIPTMAAATKTAYAITDDDATYYPTDTELDSALASLNTLTSASGNSYVSTALDNALATVKLTKTGLSVSSVSTLTWSTPVVTGTTLTKPTADATITFANADDTDNPTLTANVTLTADTLTEAEAVAAFKKYVVNYISANGNVVAGSADVKSVADAAASQFGTASGVITSVQSANLDNKGTYTISYTCGSRSGQTATGSIYTDDQVTVKAKNNGGEDNENAIKALVRKININLLDYKTGNVYDTSRIATDVAAIIGYNVTNKGVQNVSVTDDNHWSFEVYDTTDTYTVTINSGASLENDNNSLKAILDNYFKVNTFSKTADQKLRNVDIAKIVAADTDVSAELAGAKWTSDTTHAATIDGDGTEIGSDGTGKLTIDHNGTKYVYSFTANIKVSDKTTEQANADAIAAVNQIEYPDYKNGQSGVDKDGSSVSHDETWLKNEIKSDLEEAGYDKNSISIVSNGTGDRTYTSATKTSNGSYTALVNKGSSLDTVKVSLFYSSDEKSKDTNDSLLKFIKLGSNKTGVNNTTVTEHAATKTAEISPDTDSSDLNVLAANVYKYSASSALSLAIQSKTAVSATKTEDAIKVVEDQIKKQLTADGVDTNGVKVSVKAVNTYDTYDAKAVKTKISAGQSDANASNVNGLVTLLVTTSIKNDFYGDQDKMKNLVNNYLLEITTNPLKAKEVKTIGLKDKTALLTNGYFTSSKTAGQTTSGFTFVKITPEITPEDANSEVTYKIVNADKEDVTSDVKVGANEKVYAYNSDTAESIGTNELGLKITKAGTYTITAAADDAEATMTLTVRNNFKDVPATAYYADAVVWAYGADVTAGTSDDTFGTNDPVTRAQYVTWLYKYAVSQDPTIAIADDDVKSVFSDVSTTAFYAKAVQWAKENGITAGTTATTFSPDQAITRAQAIQMLWVAKGRPYAGLGQENEETLKFNDVPDNAFYKTAVKWAVQHSVTAGTSATTFGPNDICRRCQAIQFIYIGKDVNR